MEGNHAVTLEARMDYAGKPLSDGKSPGTDRTWFPQESMMAEWNLIDGPLPPQHALIIYYVPFARYIWGSGLDYSQIKAEYPGVTHWKVATLEPIEEKAP